MLWDIIREWFVKYIFGGHFSNGAITEIFIGETTDFNGNNFDLSFGSYFYVPIKGFVDNQFTGEASYISLSDWLSTTATIIVLCLLVAFLIFTTIYVFKWFAGLFKWR